MGSNSSIRHPEAACFAPSPWLPFARGFGALSPNTGDRLFLGTALVLFRLMRKLFPLLFLVAATALNAAPQSGRRISRSASAPPAPIQPPLNPEPEIKSASP